MNPLHVSSRLLRAHGLALATAASAGKDTSVPGTTVVQSVLCSGKRSRRRMKAWLLARAAAGPAQAQTCPCVADSFLFHLASWPWSAAFTSKGLRRVAGKAGKGGKLAVVAVAVAVETLRGPGCG